MNGQLSEHPLPELIREILQKNFSGRLRLELDKVKVAVYFEAGTLLYAAANLRSMRFGDYLVKNKVISEDDLLHLGSKSTEFELVRTLVGEKRLSRAQADQLQARLIADVLRVPLLWTEGTWEFDNRSRLNEEITCKVDVANLILEASRRLPPKFVASRFRNPSENFVSIADLSSTTSLLPEEGFLLSRLDSSMMLGDLIALSGVPELDAYRVIYTLALAGLVRRSSWKSAFRDGQKEARQEAVATPAVPIEEPRSKPVADSIETFLERMAAAESHYEVLGVAPQANMSELKSAYYDIARKYHPDRYRASGTDLLARIESAFARITQAYDTLRDPGLRATYDSKLDAQARASRLAQSAPKASTQASPEAKSETPSEKTNEQTTSSAQLAELQFREGFAALELRQRNVAIGLLGSAARSVPNEPRYRAYYGRALALHESTRRLAEVELQAAVKLEPQNAEYRIMLSELYRDLGFIVRAKSEAERAVAADSNNRKARDLLRSLG